MRTTLLLDNMNLERKEEKRKGGMGGDEPRRVDAAPGGGPATGGIQVHRVSLVLGGRLRGIKLNGGTLRILASAVQEKLAEAD